ncbi:MBL fold metallo-hydrolase [Brevibacillus daliensis]|uniref:MBL fold metallo-hydrolase n=1 Tax=Brevibacillus daliensis TaxID=2892995 RepID=UPI001E47BCC9|nr:MBL fold metallo-hydrolase [Brevibacillus daliensis]
MTKTYAPTMITETIGFFPGSVNIGIVVTADGAVLIDSGLDTQTAKKTKKGLDEISQPLHAIIQTHSHADHFGGNHYLLAQYPNTRVYAPVLEAAIIENPILEPIYLGMGAEPLAELRNKFLLAEPSRVDQLLPEKGPLKISDRTFEIIPLPGHSWNQCGVVVDGICFAADSYYSPEVLQKHRLPFLVDAEETVKSVRLLQQTAYLGYIPGHGDFETDCKETLQYNLEYHQTILEQIHELYTIHPSSLEEGLQIICEKREINITNMTSYVLFRTAFMGYVVGLNKQGRLEYEFKENRLMIRGK